ncbi:MAG: hypothetical protein OEZ59_07095 [Deltaproteobacteria bacterium]|nr:hypothetical protein [Deltaproteobacteria bacterium]
MSNDNIPAMQKLLDSPIKLLVVGNVVMLLVFTAWGMVEIMSLSPSALP